MADLQEEKKEDLENQNYLNFKFNGSGVEYAKIWFANLALNIITLGIYGPWAKVRKQRYLYSSTSLLEHSFDFTANPIAIFKGRALFLLFFIIYSVLEGVSLPLALSMLVVFFVALPWLIKKSLQFKMRYSEFKGLNFRTFVTKAGILYYMLVLSLLKTLSLGLLSPLINYKQRKYIVENTYFGNHNFKLNGSVKGMYFAYLVPILISIIPLILVVLTLSVNLFFNPDGLSLFSAIIMYLGIAVFISLISLVKFSVIKYVIDNLQIETFNFSIDASLAKYAFIVYTNAILFLFTLGLATPFCVIRLKKYFFNNIKVTGTAEELNMFTAAVSQEISAFASETLDLEGMEFEFGF